MTTIAIKDFKQKKVYDKLIAKKIVDFLNQCFFSPMLKTLKARNDSNLIKDGLRAGTIIYKDGVFKPLKRFTNALSLEFKKYGAKYNKYLKGFYFDEMPEWLSNELVEMQQETQIKFNQLKNLLQDFENNINSYIDSLIFDNEVITIIDDVGMQVQKNVKHISVIEPELTKKQKEEIARDYTNNMQFFVKKWSVENIVNLRKKIEKLVLEGYRQPEAVKILTKEYQEIIEKNLKTDNPLLTIEQLKRKAYNKAKFLAQNETSIMLAELKKTMYKQMGFERFKWITILDARERPLHHQLNGQIFYFDNPPIIDERTAQRGLPGETYNCRCSLIPIGDFYDK